MDTDEHGFLMLQTKRRDAKNAEKRKDISNTAALCVLCASALIFYPC
jgi:hypothetical protein